MNVACEPTYHRHPTPLVCARCGVDSTQDPTVAATPVKDGTPWPATCSHCSTKMRRLMALAPLPTEACE